MNSAIVIETASGGFRPRGAHRAGPAGPSNRVTPEGRPGDKKPPALTRNPLITHDSHERIQALPSSARLSATRFRGLRARPAAIPRESKRARGGASLGAGCPGAAGIAVRNCGGAGFKSQFACYPQLASGK